MQPQVRATHAFGGLPAKRHRLREAQLFADGGAYFYDPAAGAPKCVAAGAALRPDAGVASLQY